MKIFFLMLFLCGISYSQIKADDGVYRDTTFRIDDGVYRHTQLRIDDGIYRDSSFTNITADYVRVGDKVITVRIHCKMFPHTGKSFKGFVNQLFDKLQFLNNSDGAKYYLYVDLYIKQVGLGSTYRESAEILLDITNFWLKRHYEVYNYKMGYK